MSGKRVPGDAQRHPFHHASQVAFVDVDPPIEVYQFDLKRGSYLNAGDTVAMIGRLDRGTCGSTSTNATWDA